MAFTYIQIPNPLFGFYQMLEAAKIVDNALGNGYFNEHLKEIECGWACFHADSVVAWAAVSTERHKYGPSIGCLKCVAVDPLFRGNGIGRKLTEMRLNYLTKDDQHCFLIFADAWVRPSGYCASCGTLEHFGFKIHEEIHEHYSNLNHKCPACKGKCKCTARRYIKINQR